LDELVYGIHSYLVLIMKNKKEVLKMRKCTEEDLKGLEPTHECDGCTKLIVNAKVVYVDEFEHDGNDYYCDECIAMDID
jgi:hypothetical protein